MAMTTGLPSAPLAQADVCLLLEGTWPYVRGGVSSWVAQLITSLPELRFSVIFLGASDAEHAAPAYPIPDNVVHVQVHALLGGNATLGERQGAGRARRGDAGRFAANASLHADLASGEAVIDTRIGDGFSEVLDEPQPLREAELASHPLAWETIRERYRDAPPGLDFNHYFWSVRSMHEPLFALAAIAASAPPATIYHAVSTGYAGWLGSMIKSRRQCPYLISEHGIYTKERELDLAQVDWIPEQADPFGVGLDDGMSYLRQLWIRFFRSLGRMSYASADRIFTLYEGNRLRQIDDGAPSAKLTVIPNGVDVPRFAAVRREHATTPGTLPPPVLALIGRVVPIKDVKTFIRAMRIVRTTLPGAEAWLLGPEDEDPAYTDACRRLVANLELEDTVKFLGFGKPESIFPKIGLNVLSSVSEGQPLTVLEGFAAGVPALVTDVGSCRELIEGADQQDRALGNAGAVVPIANPALFAAAALALLTDADAWTRASNAAVARVESRYDERDLIARYRTVYERAMRGDITDSGAAC